MIDHRTADQAVAIVIRTKDRPLLLARALDDVLGQTHERWHAVVVNDGGDPAPVDAALATVRARAAGRIQVVHHPQSQGMEAASNAGMRIANGDLVVVHDDDDTWAPLFLERTIEHLLGHPDAVAVAACTEIVIERIHDGIEEIERRPFTPPGEVVTVFDLILSNRVVPIGLLLRRTALDALGGFDDTLPVVGDWEFNLRLAAHGRIEYLPGEPLAFWHQRPDTSGPIVNSVHGARDEHFRYDRLVRDRLLREYVARNGVGGILYVAKFFDERLAESENRVRDRIDAAEQERRVDLVELEARMLQQVDRIVHGHVQHHSPVATLRRALRRVFRRIGRR